MAPISTTPNYNLKVVVQETGLKPDTLRAWERRYGLPQPERTAGGHRLYSQYDIEMIKWLLARQEEGLSISRAVELWRNLQTEGLDPFRAMAAAEVETQPATADLASGAALAEIRDAWIRACLYFDEATAERALTQAFALYPPEVVCLEVLQKGVAQIGELWYRNEATVQQEHFASALAMRRLDALLAAAPPPTRAGRIIAGCPPEEQHSLATLLLTLLLRYQGWEVLYLGANVPLARLETTVQSVRPHLIVMTAQLLHTAASLRDVAHALQRERVHLAYGGLIFNRVPALRRRIPGFFLGERLQEAVRTVGQVLAGEAVMVPIEPVSEAYQKALHGYRDYQALLEGYVWQTLRTQDINLDRVREANGHLARDIDAALALGDMAYLDPLVTWTENLIVNYNMPPELLHRYLGVYYQAARQHLPQECQPVVAWLADASSQRGPVV